MVANTVNSSQRHEREYWEERIHLLNSKAIAKELAVMCYGCSLNQSLWANTLQSLETIAGNLPTMWDLFPGTVAALLEDKHYEAIPEAYCTNEYWEPLVCSWDFNRKVDELSDIHSKYHELNGDLHSVWSFIQLAISRNPQSPVSKKLNKEFDDLFREHGKRPSSQSIRIHQS